MSHWSAAPMDRNQVVLFAPTLDQSLADDHPVRLFAETLAAFDFSEWERMYVRVVGQPPIHPRVLAGCILYGLTLGPDLRPFLSAWGMVPARVTLALRFGEEPILGPGLTVLSSMFLHGGWLHLVGNMWYLWIFGDNVEDRLGHARFLVFFLLAGIVAGLLQYALNPASRLPTVGASGAIAGVLGAYLIKHPTNRVRVLMGRYITHMPAVVVLGFWILLQVFSQVSTPAGEASGVAYMAHIGGFAVGFVLILIMGRGRPAGNGRRPGLFPGSWGR